MNRGLRLCAAKLVGVLELSGATPVSRFLVSVEKLQSEEVGFGASGEAMAPAKS